MREAAKDGSVAISGFLNCAAGRLRRLVWAVAVGLFRSKLWDQTKH